MYSICVYVYVVYMYSMYVYMYSMYVYLCVLPIAYVHVQCYVSVFGVGVLPEAPPVHQ